MTLLQVIINFELPQGCLKIDSSSVKSFNTRSTTFRRGTFRPRRLCDGTFMRLDFYAPRLLGTRGKDFFSKKSWNFFSKKSFFFQEKDFFSQKQVFFQKKFFFPKKHFFLQKNVFLPKFFFCFKPQSLFK